MKNVRIIGTGSYAPEHIVTNDDLSSFIDTSDEWISSRTGIKERRISTGETTTDLSVEAAKRAIDASGIDANEIDLIIVATITPDNFTPATACEVQREIGATKAMAFDLSAACSGFVFSLNMATQYIKAGAAKTALVIGAEVLSKIADWDDRSSCVLFGDGAGAAVIARTEEKGIENFHCRSLGESSEYLTCHAKELENHYVKIESDKYLRMNGQEVFKFAITSVPECIKEVIDESNYQLNEVDHFILHQANTRIIKSIAKRLKVDESKFYMNIQNYGNTSAASIPIALDEMYKNNTLKKGDKVVIAGFGGGLTYGAGLIII